VVVMRHGHRQDEQDPVWHRTAKRPWDPPLSVKGREQVRAGGWVPMSQSDCTPPAHLPLPDMHGSTWPASNRPQRTVAPTGLDRVWPPAAAPASQGAGAARHPQNPDWALRLLCRRTPWRRPCRRWASRW
jgi:hypothetical protein